MRRRTGVALTVLALVAGSATAPAFAARPQRMDIRAGEASGFVAPHGAKPGPAHKKTNNVNMTWHNGSVLPSSTVTTIYWGTSWPTSTSDKMSGLDTWYGGFGSSAYAGSSNEYSGSNGQVTSSTSYGGHVVDGSAAPNGQPSVSTILAEVAKMVPNPAADGSGYYPVYVDTPRGNANFCAWHSYGSINGVPVQIAFFYNLDGDPGCDPGADPTKTGHSQGLDALANVSAHELSEARTDPRNGGWYDNRGNENGDKCAWAFPSAAYSLVGGQTWLMQGEWSNKAYTAGTGYANLSGQKGCVFASV